MNHLKPEKRAAVVSALSGKNYNISDIKRQTGVSRPTIMKIEQQVVFSQENSKLTTLSAK